MNRKFKKIAKNLIACQRFAWLVVRACTIGNRADHLISPAKQKEKGASVLPGVGQPKAQSTNAVEETLTTKTNTRKTNWWVQGKQVENKNEKVSRKLKLNLLQNYSELKVFKLYACIELDYVILLNFIYIIHGRLWVSLTKTSIYE